MTSRVRGLLVLALPILLSGCSSAAYYSQLATGQWDLLQAREPVSQVIADPQRPAALREQLAKAQAARTFASEHLHLPDNQSYRLYADLKRPYVVWNVFATPEFSRNRPPVPGRKPGKKKYFCTPLNFTDGRRWQPTTQSSALR